MEIKLGSIIDFTVPNMALINPWDYGDMVTISLNKLTVNRVFNIPEERKVILEVKEFISPIILWEGDSYIDNWTESDVDNRVKELYK